MARRSSNTKLKIAIIVVLVSIGVGIASFSGFDSKKNTSISFGNDIEFPKEILQSDTGIYFVDMIIENRGDQESMTIITASGENAKVKIGTHTDWDYKHTLPFTNVPDVFQKKYPIQVKPDNNTSFTIMISLETPDNLDSPEIELRHPSILTFEYDGENFVLIEQR